MPAKNERTDSDKNAVSLGNHRVLLFRIFYFLYFG